MGSGFRVCIGVLAVALAGAAAAQSLDQLTERLRGEPFELTADSLHYDMERELYVGRGDVTVRQSGRTLRADWVAFNRKTGAGVASGRVELVDGEDVVRADFIEFELETAEGVIHGGSLESESSRFRARAAEIAKTGEQTYSFRDGEFTTCDCPDPDDEDPWVLRSERAELEVEGYATARNTTFDVFGVPVVWIPWMIFPVKTERQTGFLFPELSLGSLDGFEVGLPFFWAMREEVGLVLTPRYSTDRGLGGAAFFDYVAGARSEGELLGAFYRDEEIDADTPNQPYGRNRWSGSGVHDWHLRAGLRFRTDFRFASDNEVPFDFDELSVHRSDRFLESRAALSRNFGGLGRVGAQAGANFVDDLQNPDDRDRDRFLLQRWPTARVDVLAGGVAGLDALVPSLELEVTRFDARDGAQSELPGAAPGPRSPFLDTGVDALPTAGPGPSELGFGADPHLDDFDGVRGTEGDGRFQEGEPLTDRGERLALLPRLALPLDWYGVQLVPEVGWHQTFYETRQRDFRQRGFPTARVDLSTRLRRRFGNLLHVLEPRAGYALAATGSQGRNPLFVPATAAPQGRLRALDLDAVTRDDADRIARANRATFGATNRLYRDTDSGALALLADFRLLGLYEFDREAFEAVILDGRAFPSQQVEARFHADLDPERGRFDEGLAEGRWSDPRGFAFSAGYRWVRQIPLFFENFFLGDRFDESGDADHIHQVRGGVQLDLTAQWRLEYAIAHSIEGDRVLANQARVEYLSTCGCWLLGVEISQDRTRGVDAKLVYRLVGLGAERSRSGQGLLDGLGGLW